MAVQYSTNYWKIYYSYHTSPYIKDCAEYSKESLKQSAFSNYISHIGNCKYLPSNETFDTWEAQQLTNQLENNNGGASVDIVASANGLRAQQSIITTFVQCG